MIIFAFVPLSRGNIQDLQPNKRKLTENCKLFKRMKTILYSSLNCHVSRTPCRKGIIYKQVNQFDEDDLWKFHGQRRAFQIDYNENCIVQVHGLNGIKYFIICICIFYKCCILRFNYKLHTKKINVINARMKVKLLLRTIFFLLFLLISYHQFPRLSARTVSFACTVHIRIYT